MQSSTDGIMFWLKEKHGSGPSDGAEQRHVGQGLCIFISMAEQCVEYVNLTRGKLFISQDRHLERPDRQSECLAILALIEQAPSIDADERVTMGLSKDDDYRVLIGLLPS